MGTANSKKTIYKITVKNWEKYNGTKKKGHKCILLYTGFFEDAKIATLPQGGKLLYVGLLLRCGDLCSSSIEATHDLLVRLAGGSGVVIHRLLRQLESLQLVTTEKLEPFMNRIEENRKEDKRIELPARSNFVESLPKKIEKELNREIWEAFKEAYLHRYQLEPKRNAAVNSKISQLAKRLGRDAVDIVKFYVEHPDSFYVRNMHAIGLCLRDAESLYVQWKKDKAVTTTDIRNYERNQSYQQILDGIDKGGI